MSAHRFTFEFEATTGNVNTAGSRAGWSETWYNRIDENEADALARGKALALLRKDVLTEGWSLSAIRISRLNAQANLIRRGLLYLEAPGNQPGFYNNGVIAPGIDEQPYDAIDLSVNSAGGNHRAFLMRGIGNDVISPGGRFVSPPRWVAKFPGLQQFLTNNPVQGPWASGWCLRVRTQVFPVGSFSGQYPIINVFTSGLPTIGASPQRPALEVSSLVGIIAGNTVVVQNVLGLKNLNGTWIINSTEVVDGTGYVVLKPKRGISVSGQYVGSSGWFLQYGYSLDLITQISVGNGASRRTGRPLQLLRGRRSPHRS